MWEKVYVHMYTTYVYWLWLWLHFRYMFNCATLEILRSYLVCACDSVNVHVEGSSQYKYWIPGMHQQVDMNWLYCMHVLSRLDLCPEPVWPYDWLWPRVGNKIMSTPCGASRIELPASRTWMDITETWADTTWHHCMQWDLPGLNFLLHILIIKYWK